MARLHTMYAGMDMTSATVRSIDKEKMSTETIFSGCMKACSPKPRREVATKTI
jgi:hypothetical protein